jgi:hypothetical protein
VPSPHKRQVSLPANHSRIAVRVFICFALVAVAVGLTTSFAAAQTTPTTSVPGPSVEYTGGGAAAVLAFITLIIFLSWFVPYSIQSRRTQAIQVRMLEFLENRFPTSEQRGGNGQVLTAEEFRNLMGPVTQLPATQSSLDRSLLAFAIITLFALVVGALLLSAAADAADLRKIAVTSLLNVLATIIGFFFGARTAESRGGTTGRIRPEAEQTTGADETP